MKLLKRNSIFVGSALLLLAVILLIVAAVLPRPLQSQRQAERWAGESGIRFKQFTCVLTPGLTLEPEAIYRFRAAAAEKIAAADFSLPAGGSALCDAWSCGGTLKVSGPRGSFDAGGLAGGGRFFDVHPMPLLSGGYLMESDLMKDRVVLNEQLAWLLFGGTDLAGETVQIGDADFVVVGVVAQDDDRFTRAVSEGGPALYMSYDRRDLLGSGGVTCYEVVLPEAVKGFAKSVAEDPFAKQGLVVENTGRFSFTASLQRIRSIGKLGTRTSSVVFPVWENAAISAETSCALLRFAALLCLIWPLVLAVAGLRVLLRLGMQKLRSGGRAARDALLDRRDAHRLRIVSRRGSHTK